MASRCLQDSFSQRAVTRLEGIKLNRANDIKILNKDRF